MSTFGKSLKKEIGKNTGKWISNAVFGDKHATPHKIIHQRQVQQRHKERIDAREYRERQKQLERERRENEKELKRLAKEEAESQKRLMISNNHNEVEEHNKYLEVVQTVHKDYSNFVDWREILNQSEPEYVKTAEDWKDIMSENISLNIQSEIEDLKNNFNLSFGRKMFDKMFRGHYKFLSKILFKDDYIKEQELKIKLLETEQSKTKRLNNALEMQRQERLEYELNLEHHKELLNVAKGVLDKDLNAFTYAINLFNPFQDLEEYGSDLSFSVENNNISVDFFVHSEEVLPKTTKKALRNGIEIKEEPISQSKFNEIYQDYVCSCILRISKESFLLLPINRILVNGKGSILNSATGNYEEKTIISVIIEREILDKLNFDLLDPSDSLSNFNHNMSFKKASGFEPVSELI